MSSTPALPANLMALYERLQRLKQEVPENKKTVRPRKTFEDSGLARLNRRAYNDCRSCKNCESDLEENSDYPSDEEDWNMDSE